MPLYQRTFTDFRLRRWDDFQDAHQPNLEKSDDGGQETDGREITRKGVGSSGRDSVFGKLRGIEATLPSPGFVESWS